MKPNDRIMATLKAGCICKGIKLIRLIEAIENGAASFEEVAAFTGIGDGPCQGRRCRLKVEDLLERGSGDESPGYSRTNIRNQAVLEIPSGTTKQRGEK
jgi:bacterioferritin-associated ferredoxin